MKLELQYSTLLPWSYSKWKSLRNCRLQFYMKYILKEKVPYVEAPETTIGKAAHAVVENIIAGKEFDASMALVKPQYDKKLDWKKEIEEGLGAQILSFQSRFSAFKRQHEVIAIYQEKRIALTEQFTQTTFFAPDCFYRGVVDLCLYLKNGDAVIIDHKTGAPAVMGLKNFQGQLDVYKVLSHYGISPLKGVATGVHFIRDAEIKIGARSSREDVEGTLKNNLLFTIQQEIDLWNDEGHITKTKGHYCKYCDYQADCKAGKLDHHAAKEIHVYRTQESN